MGLTFHYRGKIKRADMLQDLVAEVVDFAKINNFPYQSDLFEPAFPGGKLVDYQGDKKLYGVSFSPEKCDPIFLTFVSNGRLCSPMQLMISSPSDESDDDFFYLLFTKTQFAGVDTHILVMDFLRYLSKKYFSEFEMDDEGHYWQTQDRTLLEETFERYRRGLDIITSSFEMIPRDKDESLDDYVTRILKRSHDKYRGKG